MNHHYKRKQGSQSNSCTSGHNSTKRPCIDDASADAHKQDPTDAAQPVLISNLGKDSEDLTGGRGTHGGGLSASESQDDTAREFDTCFGMIHVQTSHLRLSALLDSYNTTGEVVLRVDDDIITIRNVTSLKYGGLLGRNTLCSKTLKKLYHQHEASFEGYLLPKETKRGKIAAYELYVILYGMQSQSDCFSKLLDSAGLFLQHPHFQDLSAPYWNPHYLRNPNTQTDFGEEISSAFSNTVPSKASKVLDDSDPHKNQLLEVIDSAQGPESFSSATSSPRLRTVLKKHQLKALSMMREKESGRLEQNEFGSVWTTMKSKKGDIRYKNLVTGSVQVNKPQICRGGVLADDMGLGKTLSAIALIASSLDTMPKVPNDGLNNRSTLIICTPILLQEWEKQISQHVHPGQMSYKIFHGTLKENASTLCRYDVVLTTYDTVVSEASKSCKSPEVTTIHSMEWHRIVLDEAHNIRNRRTKRYREISTLRAQYRWCLTGTPIFNVLEDFGSLVGFLGVYPFDKAAIFNSRISMPVKNRTTQGLETLQKLVQGVCLRRTKDAISHDLQLPNFHKALCRVELSTTERQDYEALKKSYAAILSTGTDAKTAAGSTTRIFLTMLRLRQFCDHGLDMLPDDVRELLKTSADPKAYAECPSNRIEYCAGCYKGLGQKAEYGDLFLRDCGHVMCLSCGKKKVESNTIEPDGECIACATQIKQQNMEFREYRPSSKVLALLRNLSVDRDQASLHPTKSVVFSTWTSMLDLVQTALRREGFDFVRIDGSKSETNRRSAIERFRSNKDCNVLLASIGTAGVGLDLTVASRVHLLEPQWTPMAEKQAFDRVNRMGQTQDVIVTRYIVNKTIEEYLVDVQQAKSAVIGQLFTTQGEADVQSTGERLAKYLKEDLI